MELSVQRDCKAENAKHENNQVGLDTWADYCSCCHSEVLIELSVPYELSRWKRGKYQVLAINFRNMKIHIDSSSSQIDNVMSGSLINPVVTEFSLHLKSFPSWPRIGFYLITMAGGASSSERGGKKCCVFARWQGKGRRKKKAKNTLRVKSPTYSVVGEKQFRTRAAGLMQRG